jgi:uncharacterized lipoprotein YajG
VSKFHASSPVIALSALLLAALLGLSGCAKPDYTIQLAYQPAGSQASLCANKQIAVVRFADGRKMTEIGDKDREAFFYPGEKSVTEWASRAVADELSSSGCKVQYHETFYPFNVDYIVTGEVIQVYLRQRGLLDYDANMKLKIRVQKGNDFVAEKTYSASWEKKVAPMTSSREGILMQLLQDVLRDAVPDIMDKMR